MAYDAARHQVVLYGFGTDTWVYNGTSWTLAATTGPGYRDRIQLAYDEQRQRVVLFGGFIGLMQPIIQNDTWEWDGSAWTRVAITGPSRRSGYAMTYDSHRGKVVLFGGSNNVPTFFNDTWEWDGITWTQIAMTGPSPRRDTAMAYDPARREIILFGGQAGTPVFDDTWAFSVPRPADFNNDFVTDSRDFFDYLTAFFTMPTCPSDPDLPCPADFNNDRLVNSADFFAFLAAFFAGC